MWDGKRVLSHDVAELRRSRHSSSVAKSARCLGALVEKVMLQNVVTRLAAHIREERSTNGRGEVALRSLQRLLLVVS